MKMRYEVGEGLSFSRELTLYLMKRPPLCDADLEQHPMHLQTQAAAESDAKGDVEVLAYFGAGMSATFTAGMCGLMTGFVTDSTLGHGQDECFYLTASMSAAGAFSLLLRYYIRPPNPPPERLIGKSPEYVKCYADVYRARIRAYQIIVKPENTWALSKTQTLPN